MKLTGVAVPSETLSKIEPNTALMVISDENGKISVVKIDRKSIESGESLVRVAGGCWLPYNGGYKWYNPCPF